MVRSGGGQDSSRGAGEGSDRERPQARLPSGRKEPANDRAAARWAGYPAALLAQRVERKATMIRLRWFLTGALTMCVAAAAILILGARGFSAREQPNRLESWLARRARSAAVPLEARALANPVPDTPDVQAAARAHWADHCAQCHANDGSGETAMGKRTYPPAPDMRLAPTQHMTDGELFYVIQNGIRFSGMPAWGDGSDHDSQDSWKLVHFVRHLPHLTWEEKKEMEKLNPKSPDELREEEQEERFLKGEDKHEPQMQHHKH
jgi:mono/diheme cytochrome c family protein